MKKYVVCTLILAVFLFTGFFRLPHAIAGPASDALGTCMVDSLSGKERKQLAKWIFFAMSAHPEITAYSKVTQQVRTENDKAVGQLITRLLVDDCPDQAKQALRNESSVALQNAFELVGRVAMQELMTDRNVATAISRFERYADKQKINELGSRP